MDLETRVPSKEEIKKLPARASVLLAARSAVRVLGLYRNRSTGGREGEAALENCIVISLRIASSAGADDFAAAKAASAKAAKASDVADAKAATHAFVNPSAKTGFEAIEPYSSSYDAAAKAATSAAAAAAAAFATSAVSDAASSSAAFAATSASAAAKAAKAAASAKANKAAAAAAAKAASSAVSAADGDAASAAAIIGRESETRVDDAIRRDFEKLLELSVEKSWSNLSTVTSSFLGPLWEGNPPEWYTEEDEALLHVDDSKKEKKTPKKKASSSSSKSESSIEKRLSELESRQSHVDASKIDEKLKANRDAAIQGVEDRLSDNDLIATIVGDAVEAQVKLQAESVAKQIEEIDQLREGVKKTAEETEAKKTEIEKLKSELEAVAEKVGVRDNAEHFENLATSDRWSRWWWSASILLIVGLVLWETSNAAKAQKEAKAEIDPIKVQMDTVISNGLETIDLSLPTSTNLIRFLEVAPNRDSRRHLLEIASDNGPRILRFILYYTALALCIRNFSAAKHNEIVNLTRATALKTFMAFMDSKASRDTQDAVLLETTRSIFAHRPTGFEKGGSGDGTNVINQMTERLHKQLDTSDSGKKPEGS